MREARREASCSRPPKPGRRPKPRRRPARREKAQLAAAIARSSRTSVRGRRRLRRHPAAGAGGIPAPSRSPAGAATGDFGRRPPPPSSRRSSSASTPTSATRRSARSAATSRRRCTGTRSSCCPRAARRPSSSSSPTTSPATRCSSPATRSTAASARSRKTIEARKPFSVDPKLPLEISHTDTIDVPVRVTNDSDDPRNVAVQRDAERPQARRRRCRTSIDLGPNGKGRKIFRLKADKLEGDAGAGRRRVRAARTRTPSLRTIRVVPDGFPGVGSVSDMIEGRATRHASRCRRTWCPARSRSGSKSTRPRWPTW